MDPLSIVTAVAGVTKACYTTACSLHDLQSKFKDAPVTMVAISSEMTVVSASLAHMQSLLLQRRDLGRELGSEQSQLTSALDTSLTGCLVLFSCLDEEINRISSSTSKDGHLTWLGRARLVMNSDKLRELLTALRGQQTAINLLIQLVQTSAIADIKQSLSDNKPTLDENVERSKSFRSSLSAGKSVPESVLERADSILKHRPMSEVYTHIARSDIEFEFDDAVVNSRTYRRAMAAAAASAKDVFATVSRTEEKEQKSSQVEHPSDPSILTDKERTLFQAATMLSSEIPDLELLRVAIMSNPEPQTASLRRLLPVIGSTLIATHDFKARSTDELSLSIKDMIQLIELDEGFGDGWYWGRNIETNAFGLFPEMYTIQYVAPLSLPSNKPGHGN